MTLAVVDTQALYTFMGRGLAAFDDEHFIIGGNEVGADTNARLVLVSGGVISLDDVATWTPSGNPQTNQLVIKIPGVDKFLTIQLTLDGGNYYWLGRVGELDTLTDTITMGSEYSAICPTNIPPNGAHQLCAVSDSTFLLWYQTNDTTVGLDAYVPSKYRAVFVSGTTVAFGPEKVFKDENNVLGVGLDSQCGLPVAVTRIWPNETPYIYMVYKNIDTATDGVYGVFAYYAGGDLLSFSDLYVSSDNAATIGGQTIENGVAPLLYNRFITGHDYQAAGGNGFAWCSSPWPIESGPVYDLSTYKDGQGFYRINNSTALMATDGDGESNARIVTLTDVADKTLSFGTELAIAATGGDHCTGLYIRSNDSALIIYQNTAVLIDSDADELVLTDFDYPLNDKLYVASGVLGTTLDYKSDTNYFVQIVEGMAVDDQMGKVWVGNILEAEIRKVDLAQSDDDYATWDEYTDTLPDNITYSLRRVK